MKVKVTKAEPQEVPYSEIKLGELFQFVGVRDCYKDSICMKVFANYPANLDFSETRGKGHPYVVIAAGTITTWQEGQTIAPTGNEVPVLRLKQNTPLNFSYIME